VLTTRFTDRFGVERPVLSAPMALVTGASLAGAVSAAGGLGTFGGTDPRRGPAWLRAEVDKVRSATDKPFGVGFITHFLPMTEALFDAALEAAVPVVALSFAPVEPWLRRARDAGAKVVCQVQTMALARDALDAGADALAVQGHEAGGHTGVLGLLPFLTRVLEVSGDTPVLAAGGVANGRALAAVLAAGADGAWIGSAFLATPEASDVPAAYKDLVVGSDGEDTVFTSLFDRVGGYPWPDPIATRMHRTPHTDAWAGREAEIESHLEELRAELPGLLDLDHFEPEVSTALYGESAGSVSAVQPAAEVVRRLCEDAEALLRDRLRIVQ
jgi:nitronate monooxygenase